MTNKLINYALLLIAFIFITESTFAQQTENSIQKTLEEKPIKKTEKTKTFTSRLWYGGNMGLNFNNRSLNLNLAPMIGYKVTENFSVGLKLPVNYINSKFSLSGNTSSYSNLNYGLGVFTRYTFFKNFFAHAEYNRVRGRELTFYDRPSLIDPNKPREFLKNKYQRNELNLGLGFRTRGKVGFEFSALYNVFHNPQIRATPLSIRAGVSFKF